MNILITIVMDETNYRGMAQLSHITAQLFYVGELGHDPCSMTMTQLSHSVPTLPHLTVPTLPITAIFVNIKITESLLTISLPQMP